jgi:glycosidase
MIALRKVHTTLHEGDFIRLEGGSKSIPAAVRQSTDEKILVLHNLSSRQESFVCANGTEMARGSDLLTGQRYVPKGEQLIVPLQPYQTVRLWIQTQVMIS